MPDLSLPAARQYWKGYDDPSIYQVITFMEGVEEWTLDGQPNVEQAMQHLGEELDNISNISLDKLSQEELFIRIAGNIKTSRGLRLLQAIDTVHPGSASRILMYAEENSVSHEDPAGIFLKRNIIFERFRLLSRVFSEQRFNLILKAIEGES
ncbi:MAG: phosphoesterase [Legionellales bacterium]|nr:phosphoesterase [Legionellales bacterium]